MRERQVKFIAVGKKGRSTFAFRRYETVGEYVGFTDRPAYADAQAIAHRVAELYIEGEIDRAVLVFNAYVSPLVQTVTELDLLPISADILETDEEERRDDAMRGDFIFEPEPEEILARLLPVYLETQVYRALLESAASEQGARMTAMRNASKNAGELIDSLTLQMNRARQAEITQEILEVAGAERFRISADTSAWSVAGAGLCPAGGQRRLIERHGEGGGPRGTMGSPVSAGDPGSRRRRGVVVTAA